MSTVKKFYRVTVLSLAGLGILFFAYYLFTQPAQPKSAGDVQQTIALQTGIVSGVDLSNVFYNPTTQQINATYSSTKANDADALTELLSVLKGIASAVESERLAIQKVFVTRDYLAGSEVAAVAYPDLKAFYKGTMPMSDFLTTMTVVDQ